MQHHRHAQTTLPKALGELELTVMTRIWQDGPLSARQLQAGLRDKDSLTARLTTVQTTLERLVRKTLLKREKYRHAFIYSAQINRAEYMGRMMGDVVQLLHDGKASTLLSSFVNVAAGIEDSALDELERMIREKRRQLSAATREDS